MNKQKTIIALGGAITMVASLLAPQEVISYGLIATGGAICALAVLPLAAIIFNPLVDKALSTKFGESLGSNGRLVFRFLFSVPSLKRKKVRIE